MNTWVWSILEFDGIGDTPDDCSMEEFEALVRSKTYGYVMAWEELKNFAKSINQTFNCLIVAAKTKQDISRDQSNKGVYWYKFSRKDGIFIILAFSIYQSYVDIIVHNNPKIVASSLSLEKCSEIRVLDEEKKCLEILHTNNDNRCFLSLLGNSILEYSKT